MKVDECEPCDAYIKVTIAIRVKGQRGEMRVLDSLGIMSSGVRLGVEKDDGGAAQMAAGVLKVLGLRSWVAGGDGFVFSRCVP
jgi:hypothetical protein